MAFALNLRSFFAGRRNDFLIAAIIGFASGFFAVVSLACVGTNGGLRFFLSAVFVFPVLTIGGLATGLYLARFTPAFFHVVKFGIVGGFNTMLELVVVNVCIVFFNVAGGLPFIIFKTISFLMAAVSAYFWHRLWTFQIAHRSSWREFLLFALSGLCGLLLNVGVATFLVSGIGTPPGVIPIVWVNASILIAVLVAMAWNFVMQRFVLFRSR